MKRSESYRPVAGCSNSAIAVYCYMFRNKISEKKFKYIKCQDTLTLFKNPIWSSIINISRIKQKYEKSVFLFSLDRKTVLSSRGEKNVLFQKIAFFWVS